MAASPIASVDDIRAQLARVPYPGFKRDIVSFGMVRDVRVHDGRVTVLLTAPTAKKEVIAALKRLIAEELGRLAGITTVDVEVAQAPPARQGANLFDERAPLPGIGRIIAVASGKGGVGKSTVAVNLALALHALPLKVGLLDADVYGPSVPHMMGTSDARPRMIEGKRIFPIERHGLSLMSMGFFLDDKSPVIWRGPMVMSIVQQFLKDVMWGELDILVIDLPPGTGDAQLTLVQQAQVSGGIIVTTPQDVALQDVRRGISMFQAVETPVLGVVENMSYYLCPGCGKREEIFGCGGGRREAQQLGVELLGEIPLLAEIRAGMDRGIPLVVADPAHEASAVFTQMATKIVAALERESKTAGDP